MTRTEDLVRSTTRALAGTVQAVRPLPPLPQAPRPDEVSRGRGRRWAGRLAPLAATARRRAAPGVAADVMAVRDAPERQQAERARGWLVPLAAAANVVVIVLGSVIAAHRLASPTRAQGGTATPARAPRPEFYMTATYPSSGPNVLRIQVRRTAGGAVTASTSLPAAKLGWGGYLAAAAGDRAFFIAHYPCSSTAAAVTTFYRITVTGSGRIGGIAAAGRVQGMVTDLAVSPGGAQMAYNALPGKCLGRGFRSPAADAVRILDLSTGAVRTWQNTNTTERDTIGGLSWASDGRTLIIDEYSRVPGREPGLTVFGLNTASSGGSLQAHSKTLLQQNHQCSSSGSTCTAAVLAGPRDSLTALESRAAGQQQTRVLVVRIPLAAGRPRAVLYSYLYRKLSPTAVRSMGLFADSSGQWVLLWPTAALPAPPAAGWISGGRLHPLPGVAEVFPQGIAW